MIARINYDLVLTYSWGKNDHGICGHTYEVIEYYFILKDHFNVCMLFCEDFNEADLRNIIESKYSFSEAEINDMVLNTIFKYKPKVVQCKNILFTDGGINNLKDIILYCDNKIIFSCTKYPDSDFITLQDQRVYNNKGSIDYIKKILFSKLKPVNESDNKTLLYLTKNCRNISKELLDSIINTDTICIVNTIPSESNGINYVLPPVKNLFSKFNKYIYTPLERKWDCSSRFIAECKWYNKEVEYLVDYFDTDTALYFRKYDIENNFDLLDLKEDDSIINILKEIT